MLSKIHTAKDSTRPTRVLTYDRLASNRVQLGIPHHYRVASVKKNGSLAFCSTKGPQEKIAESYLQPLWGDLIMDSLSLISFVSDHLNVRFERQSVRDTPLEEPQKLSDLILGETGEKRFTRELQWAFEKYPIEDGMSHPAENIIDKALISIDELTVLNSLRDICLNADNPYLASSVLRCVGRKDNIGTSSWRVALVREGLSSGDLEIRDAAAQAADWWADSDSDSCSEIINILDAHSEPVWWLKNYIRDIIDHHVE